MGATASTTRDSPVRPRFHYFLFAAVLASIGVAVLILAWPRLLASIRFLPVDRAIALYYATGEIPSDRLPVLVRFAGEAIGRHDHYRYHDGLSLLHYLRGIDRYTPGRERREAYRQAEAAAVESLKRAPAQPGLWMRLANIRWILGAEPAEVIAPWKLSVFSGRTDSALMAQRVDLGLSHRSLLDAEGISMLRDQMLLAWRLRPGSVVGILQQRDRGLAGTRELIGSRDPAALAEMEAWIEGLR